MSFDLQELPQALKGCVFQNVQKGFIAQTGDPTGTGTSGDSIYRFLHGDHMDGTFIDDRKMHVGFNQSSFKIWRQVWRKDSQHGKDHVAKSPEKRELRRHGSEKIHRRSSHGYGEGRKRHGDERYTEDKAGKYDGRRQEFRELERVFNDKLSKEKKLQREEKEIVRMMNTEEKYAAKKREWGLHHVPAHEIGQT
ncbi:Cyclophilin-like domain superfamily [Arabidopsis suecica]|uniref:Cyclophilin-like domain superfamily n=1 Tax=Arabidopsis suecica TaxID=45249 RepID=A0A8T2HAW3_ARASU|nr:Cyclophilin-like domain superfamily [Arabidopsis suecica]